MEIAKVNNDFLLAPLKAAGYEAPACITCGDEAVQMQIVELGVDGDPAAALGRAKDGGTEVIDISLVQPVALGDMVLAHARTAIAKPC